MNNKIKEFRKLLAESGMELTIEQASDLYCMALRLLKKSKKISQLDIWKMQELKIKNMTEKQKEEAISLYQHIKDMF